jgi:hypothetical protein
MRRNSREPAILALQVVMPASLESKTMLDTVRDAPDAVMVGWTLALSLLSLALIGLVAWMLPRWRRLEQELFRERMQRRHLERLAPSLDGWLWQTDERHRIVRLQAPQAEANRQPSKSHDQARQWIGQPLDELLQLGAGSLSLRELLERGHELRDTACAWASASTDAASRSSARALSIRALPQHGADGRFSGYLGVLQAARPASAAEAVANTGAAPALEKAAADAGSLAADSAGAGLNDGRLGVGTARRVEAQAANGANGSSTLMSSGLRSGTADGSTQINAASTGGMAGSTVAQAGSRLASSRAGSSHTASSPSVESLAAEQASFTYTVTHDLRAPIRVVEGFTRIVKEDYGQQLDRVGLDHLDRVLGAAARMNAMIDALLGLTRLSQQPMLRQPVQLSRLAGYIVDDLRRTSPDRQVSVLIEPDLVVDGDPTLLRIVLENLLGNAWKYTAKVSEAQIHFQRDTSMPGTAFLVRDNGAGFDMRFADRLFGVFQRLHSASDFPGTGIGLASVQRIVRRHGGEIWAESAVGRGSSFRFSLSPAAVAEPMAEDPATQHAGEWARSELPTVPEVPGLSVASPGAARAARETDRLRAAA